MAKRIGGAACTAALVLALCGACHATAPAARPEAEGDPPETVVLLHGLGRSNMAMWLLADRIEAGGFAVVRVGYDSVNAALEDILREIGSQIAECCARSARPVHFVGHSLGGLLIRAYLAEHRPRVLGRVVLIGTPNQGTPVVDHFRERWWLKLLGEPASSLGTGPDAFPRSLPPPDYPVGVIAGEWDGIENEDVLPGRDDGLVPVESTKLPGMTDFLVVNSSHSMLRYDQTVAQQTVRFLQTGHFLH